jgi:hypothetical protein
MRELYHPQCTCGCHKDGEQILHNIPCCDLVYYKYIDKDGNIDLIRFNDVLRIEYPRKAPYIDGGEYVVKNKYNYDSSKVKEKRRNK